MASKMAAGQTAGTEETLGQQEDRVTREEKEVRMKTR